MNTPNAHAMQNLPVAPVALGIGLPPVEPNPRSIYHQLAAAAPGIGQRGCLLHAYLELEPREHTWIFCIQSKGSTTFSSLDTTSITLFAIVVSLLFQFVEAT